MPAVKIGACVICDLQFSEADEISALDCGHIYHQGCISQWIQNSNTCPDCRTKRPKINRIFMAFREISTEGTEDVVQTLKEKLESNKREFEGRISSILEANRYEYAKLKLINTKLESECEMNAVIKKQVTELKIQNSKLQEETERLKAKFDEEKRQKMLYYSSNLNLQNENRQLRAAAPASTANDSSAAKSLQHMGAKATRLNVSTDTRKPQDDLPVKRPRTDAYIPSAASFTSRLGSRSSLVVNRFNLSNIPTTSGIRGFFDSKVQGSGASSETNTNIKSQKESFKK